jgi:hypothetical protein
MQAGYQGRGSHSMSRTSPLRSDGGQRHCFHALGQCAHAVIDDEPRQRHLRDMRSLGVAFHRVPVLVLEMAAGAVLHVNLDAVRRHRGFLCEARQHEAQAVRRTSTALRMALRERTGQEHCPVHRRRGTILG